MAIVRIKEISKETESEYKITRLKDLDLGNKHRKYKKVLLASIIINVLLLIKTITYYI